MKKFLKKAFVTHPGILFIIALIIGAALMYYLIYAGYVPLGGSKP